MSFTLGKYGAKITVPDLTVSNATVRSYPLIDSRFESAMEQEFTFTAKPQRMSFPVPVTVKDAVFYRQPPLTEVFKQAECAVWTETYVKTKTGIECHRPIDIVESLAVYHSFKRNNLAKTGKIMHIPRPKCMDKNGVVAWGKIAYQNDSLVITLPQEFMNKAVYPVIVDPTFGYTSIGASTDGWGTGAVVGCHFTLSEAGSITSISSYGYHWVNNAHIKYAVYNNSTGALLEVSDSIAVPDSVGWRTADLVSPYSASAAEYFLPIITDDSQWNCNYDSGAAGVRRQQTSDVPAYPDFPDPFSETANYAMMHSIYATYTATGGGVPIPVAMHHYGHHINKIIRG